MTSTAATRLPTAVSCPAKVLVAGGYLVLDRHYTGLVFGLDARIHTVVEPLKTTAGVSISEIVVTSPQFHGAIWEYGYRAVPTDGGMSVTQLSVGHEQSISASKNPFIETALTYALSYIWMLQPGQRIAASSIRILADQAYYSNPGRRKQAALNDDTSQSSKPSHFLDFNVSLKNAHKTGLGSSAALVTSFTAAVLSFYLPKELFDLDSPNGQLTLHNLAQASHSHAQGKVGSGFDIASAVYGSCLYKRFSPSLLTGLPQPGGASFGTSLRRLIEKETWDTEVQKATIQMPAGLRLVMCDVDCGSETPGMVKQVLAWRQENQGEADALWARLQEGNDALAAELTRLATAADAAAVPDSSALYTPLRTILENNRALIRQMTDASGVPIEPAPQTRLLNFCIGQAGVVGGLVPGAGGYDAIVLFVVNSEDVLAGLREALTRFNAGERERTVEVKGDGASEVRIGKVGVLGVREEMQGVKRESLDIYSEWDMAV